MTERHPTNTLLVDLIGAIVCGYLFAYFLTGMSDDPGDMDLFIKVLVWAVGSYIFVALLLAQLKKRVTIRIPSWMLIGIFGAMISCLILLTINNEINGWHDRKGLPPFEYASAFIREMLRDLAFGGFWFGVPSLIVMGVVHYIGSYLRKFGSTLSIRFRSML